MTDPSYEIQKTHLASIEAGKAFAEAYKNNEDNTLDLLEKYIELRREIPRDNVHGNRFGCTAAFNSTRGYDI
jgi:hypothetical protein